MLSADEFSALNIRRAHGLLSVSEQEALAPYRVDNAIIMAAGLASRFAPLSHEKPKGLLVVKGEVLIERQIRQLHAAGIEHIIVVVGHMKEQFAYLAEQFNVELVENPAYATRNNNASIMQVANKLGNSYICSSDNYFTENPFEPYVHRAYYSAVYIEGPTQEYCLKTAGADKLIVDVEVGGCDSWVMLGHAYWSRAYSQEFVRILNEVYNEPRTANMLWEDIYIEHLNRLPMYMREYAPGIIWEFDSLDELLAFDPTVTLEA